MGKLILAGLIFLAGIVFSFWLGEQIAITQSLNVLFVIMGFASLTLSFFRPPMGLGLMLVATLLLPTFEVGRLREGQYAMERAIRLRAEDFIILAVCAGWFAKLAITKIVGWREEREKVPFLGAIYLFIVVMLVATVIGLFLETTSLRRSFFFFGKRMEYFVIFFMTIHVIRSYDDFIKFFKLFLTMGAVVTCFGVIEVFIMRRSMAVSTFQESGANALASFLLILVPILLHLQHRTRDAARFRWMLYLAAAGLTLLYSRSRGAYLAFPFVFMAYIALTRRYRLIFPFVVILAAGAYFLPKDIKGEFMSMKGIIARKNPAYRAHFERYKKRMTPKELSRYISRLQMEPSWQSRIMGSAIILEILQKNPILGGGMGSVELAFTDNEYTMEVASTGILGLCLFFWMIYKIGWFAFQLWNQTKSEDEWASALCVGFLSGLMGMMVHGMTITNFYTVRTMVPFWFLLGLLVVIYRTETVERSLPVLDPQARQRIGAVPT